MIIRNITVSGNRSVNFGGGVHNIGSGTTMTITNSTLSGNTSGSSGGGGFYTDADPAILQNSIIADNTPDDCLGENYSGNNNLDSDGTCPDTTGTITPGTDYDTTLADNGGPTQTLALLAGSVAINGSGAGATSADQRGAPAVGTRDIGAYEFQGVPQSVSFTVDETTLIEDGTPTQATVTITVVDYNAPFDVSFAFSGTATGADYTTAYAGPYTISSNGNTTLFTIDILTDALTEGAETLTLEMFVAGTAGITGINPQSITFLDTPPPGEDNPQPQPTQDTSALENVEQLPQTGESPLWRNWLLAMLVLAGVGLLTASGVLLRR
jgi:hypothetical protein